MFAMAFNAYDAAFDVEFSPTSVKMDELMTRFDDVWMDPLTSRAYCGTLDKLMLVGESTMKFDALERITKLEVGELEE